MTDRNRQKNCEGLDDRPCNLKEKLESFYEKTLDDIHVEKTPEIDTGDPVGKEEW